MQTYSFHPSQIVCLEDHGTKLYAEVIQIAIERHACWARPLLMVIDATDAVDTSWEQTISANGGDRPSAIIDLRQGSDLLLPVSLFRAALDTELIPAMAQLGELKHQSELAHHNRRTLQAFITRLCQSNPDAFQA